MSKELFDEVDREIASQVPQGGEDWHKLRIARFTSSSMHRLMANVKRDMTDEEIEQAKIDNPKSKAKTIIDENILSDGALTYVKEIVWETLSGQSVETGFGRATEFGEMQEGYAREAFEILYKKKVEFAGFDISKEFPEHAGGSSDGKIPDENAIIEIKNPFNGGIFIDYCLMDEIEMPEPYYIQCQSNLMFSGAEKCYFIAFDNRLPLPNQMRVIEMMPNKRVQDLIRLKLKLAIAKKMEILGKLLIEAI